MKSVAVEAHWLEAAVSLLCKSLRLLALDAIVTVFCLIVLIPRALDWLFPWRRAIWRRQGSCVRHRRYGLPTLRDEYLVGPLSLLW